MPKYICTKCKTVYDSLKELKYNNNTGDYACKHCNSQLEEAKNYISNEIQDIHKTLDKINILL